jgi:enterochelin esterase-like enzyme
MMRSDLAALACALMLFGCGGGGGGAGGGAPTATIPAGAVTTFSLPSAQTGVTYPISVYVPADAASGPPAPVIYVLDAETRFEKLRDVMITVGVRATMVGVGNTGDERRQTDFLMPGADPYYRFLAEELVPAIESRYRVDAAQRILSGHSSSGLFAAYALFKETPAHREFAAFICADASFWQQPAEVAQAEAAMYAADAGHDFVVTMVMGGDSMGNLAFVTPVYQMLVARDYPGMRIAEFSYDLGHVPMDTFFFRDALGVVFPLAH